MYFDDTTFDQLVNEAIESLPAQFRDRMENISIEVQPLAEEQTCRQLGLDNPYELLGLYKGVPLPERNVGTPYWPDSIVIYKRAIEASASNRRQAVRQIRKTVLHEVGHYFGLDEDDLEELGYR